MTDTASWMRAVRVGDGITAVEGQPVSSVAEARSVLTRRWCRTAGGKWMEVQIVRDGQATQVEFRKPTTQPVPR